MNRWHGKTAVVTGAASGIGRSITEALLYAGINVVGLDVQIERLKNYADELKASSKANNTCNLYPMKCDVSRDDDIKLTFSWIENQLGGVHILVNNAGVVDYKPVIEGSRESFEKLVNVNLLGTASCIREAVESMRKHKWEGHIFNVNSVLGHEIPERAISKEEGANGWNLYPACKHATVALTHTVRREISRAGLPIRITSISPGLVKTDISKHVDALKNFFDNVPALSPHDIAQTVIYALGMPAQVQITEMTVRRTGEL